MILRVAFTFVLLQLFLILTCANVVKYTVEKDIVALQDEEYQEILTDRIHVSKKVKSRESNDAKENIESILRSEEFIVLEEEDAYFNSSKYRYEVTTRIIPYTIMILLAYVTDFVQICEVVCRKIYQIKKVMSLLFLLKTNRETYFGRSFTKSSIIIVDQAIPLY